MSDNNIDKRIKCLYYFNVIERVFTQKRISESSMSFPDVKVGKGTFILQ
jgi:hypothetical protein